MSQSITITYLQMLEPEQLRRSPAPRERDALLRRAEVPCPALNRFLYTAVGGDWFWRDRLAWSQARWMEYLDRPCVQTWLLTVRGTPAGYVELEHRQDEVEIVYFGLLREFIGQGFGGWLLGEGIARAWDFAPRRVSVHTCSLDGPAALPNYLARGMSIVSEETRVVSELGAPDGPWLGAHDE